MHSQEVKSVKQLPHLIDKKLIFNSKVARNIFFLFILCALIPLCLLAYYAFNQVTDNLYSQAQEQLRQTSKASGMSIVERLQLLEAELDMISNSLQTGDEEMLAYSLHLHNDKLRAEFNKLVLTTDNGGAKTLLGSMSALPTLSNDEQQYLRSGKTLVITRPVSGSRTSVYMVKSPGQTPSSHDLLFSELNPEYLWGGEDSLYPMTELFVLDQSNNVIFSSFPEYLPLHEMKNAMGENPSTGRFTWRYGNDSYEASYWTIFMRPQFNTNWLLVQSQSSADILAPISNFRKFFLLSGLLTFFIVILLSLRQIRRSLIPIELLREATKKIAGKDFNSRVIIGTNDEFEELGASFNEMATHLGDHLQNMSILNQIGIALSEERSNDRLLELILFAAKTMTSADGCALYTLTGDKQLRLSVMNIDSIHLVMNRDGNMVIPLFDDGGKPNTLTAVAFSAFKDATVNIPDMYHATSFDFSHIRDFDRTIGYRSHSLLSVPVKNHENEIVGVLQLINAQERTSRTVVPFSDEDQRLLETLASQAAVALSKNQLIDDFRKLFDSLVELIATAIDEKSPYTGDHCRRVPELTMMLAEAVAGRKEGVFKDIKLSEEEMYELKVAALLHDCGKVTTPVHIVDKATRLEAIFDRIHLIDAHFEILRRDAQIAFLQKQISLFPMVSGNKSSAAGDGVQIVLAREELEKTLEQIDKDQKLVRACNSGETVMNDDLKQRIENIALKYRWINAECKEEPLISLAEAYTLTSAKGTLTPEERAVINQHIKTTIKMLGSLHYPKSLRNVPIFAETHHEHMDGTGYPMGLTREQIPLQGRIIAIADIFESLTANDRPYKKGLTLIEALQMLSSMKDNGHIDPDLFDLFVEEKVYLRYAEKYLSHTQVDENLLCEKPKIVSPPSQQLSPDCFDLN